MAGDDLTGVIRSIEAAQRGQQPIPTDYNDAFRAAVDQIVLGAPKAYTWHEFLALTGRDEDSTRRLWRAVGFPLLDEGRRIFTENDVAADQMLHQMTESGLLSPKDTEAVTRAIAQALARLADWQVTLLHRVIAENMQDIPAADALEIASSALPMLERAQNLVWRRHLDAAISRRILTVEPLAEVHVLTVGFADLVGFTLLTRSLAPAELNSLLDRFEQCVSSIIVDEGGQVVKTVGDEVLFIADGPQSAARIALAMHRMQETDSLLPQFRVGLATGDVLSRYGDVFGEPVNRASRLTETSSPGQTLLDTDTAEALFESGWPDVTAAGRFELAGIGSVRAWTIGR